ncbi:MAG: hypothetical protein QXJ62_02345 [Nitrososphaeria archaeon]|jgi:hypothetical protein|uniref:Uncharacterized protein n=1 Tax=Ferroplasma acidiphilum TaxID=74969 RepID=A0A7K4FLF5_9ARCH|nr:hypothetical protein [Ferroplasma acidiphilum]NOL59884.1 hypothetical protein [Ferroplasma acidiphilum]WMT52654.1 MAG: hypothetical protein RE473_06495 [Ferroplasma acidiphilum]
MVASSRTRSGSRVDAKDPTDYFFFLVSFLVVIIFAIAPLYLTVFAKLNPTDSISLVSFENQLDSFAKVIVPLVIFGAFLGYLGTEIELSKTQTIRLFGQNIRMKQKLTLHLSTVVLFVAFLVELYFVWVYVYL